MMDLSEYESLAAETGVFKDIELEILKEGLLSWRDKPGQPYTVVELRDGRLLAGFALLCREASAEFTFEAKAICIEPSYVGKGVADGLLAKLEEAALGAEPSAILRIETSTRKEAAMGPGLLGSKPYALIGHIPDFYAPGDDYFMYARHLFRGAAARNDR